MIKHIELKRKRRRKIIDGQTDKVSNKADKQVSNRKKYEITKML